MLTAPLNVKTDPKIKKEAMRIAEDLGLNLSGVVNAYLRHFVKTKTIHFSLNEEKPSKWLLETIKEAKEEIKRGDVSPYFDNAKDAVKWLNKS